MDELKELCKKLGQPMSKREEEAAEKLYADHLKSTGKSGLDFDNFLKWWLTVFNDGAKNKRKFVVNKFLRESSNFDITQLKTDSSGEGLAYRLRFYYGNKQISPW